MPETEKGRPPGGLYLPPAEIPMAARLISGVEAWYSNMGNFYCS